ncbi:hypothetical protein [Archangium lipolyticum]|uniref:hypothetical protein n=1 Tax=Archangium lipolyticum TaxID=2970465 RepID=UPI00214A1A9D|nr:hypothetical protein [Archangium lipolyticum]
MTSPVNNLLRQAVLTASSLLTACGSAAYTIDSATSACRQNPAYCAHVAGEETIVPTLRSAAQETVVSTVKGGTEAASVVATLKVLFAKKQPDIEKALVECVDWADTAVNRKRFGGNDPTRTQCQEEVEKDPCGKPVTRAMQLGTEKHRLAIQCTKEKLDALIPGRFSLEQRYRYDEQTGQKQLVSPEEERALKQQGCSGALEGTLVPDVVIHSGNPLQALAVYDFKFPCPITNRPRWKPYPHLGVNQGDMYRKLLEVAPNIVTPIRGIIRWLASLE